MSQTGTTTPDKRQTLESARSDTARGAGMNNMRQLIQLRWFAIFGQVATIAVVHFLLEIRLPLASMLTVVGYLAAFNLASLVFWRPRHHVGDAALLFSVLVDVAALTAQLHFSGGVANPFVFLYLLQVAMAAVMLPAWASWVVVTASSVGALGLVIFPGPVRLQVDPSRGIADPYVQGMLICFLLAAVLVALFVGRIGRILRDRDARLADLRQQAAEEEHIVRMGLLASGAAHELGTPLATLSVLLGDWRHMVPFKDDPELKQDLDEMQSQLARCKSIVTGILLSAGDARGEAPAETTLGRFLDELVEEWRDTRPVGRFDYRRVDATELPIVSDSGLKQMVGNILDNALEASPDWVGLEAHLAGEAGDLLRLTVSDAGPGFTPETLANFGKPYNSSKGRAGGGLGLFLSLNVARSLGGRLSAANRQPRGAEVTLELPLSAISIADAAHDPDLDDNDDD